MKLQCYLSRFLFSVWSMTSALAVVVFVAHFTARLIPHIAGGGFARDIAPFAHFPVHGARVGVQSGEKGHKSVTQFLDDVGAILRELPADAYETGLAELHSGKLHVSIASPLAHARGPGHLGSVRNEKTAHVWLWQTLLIRSPLAEFLLSRVGNPPKVAAALHESK